VSHVVHAERARWPWIVFASAATFGLLGLVFIVLKGDQLTGDIANFIAFMSMGVVGALILSRDRRNVIGALLLWAVISIAIAFAATEWSGYLYEHGSTSLAAWVGWPGSTFWLIGFFPLLIFLPLLFPDGKVPSPRWRISAWIGLAWCSLGFLAVGFADDIVTVGSALPNGDDVELANPLHIPGLDFPSAVGGVMWIGLLGLFVLSIVAMILRFRRSTGIERQQLRWFSFAAVFLAAYFIFSSVLESVGVTEGTLGEVISALGYLGLVAAIGVAILQYRLWDLDVVVKKTIVAGALVVLAVLVYAGAVALIGAFAMDRNRPALLFLIALVLGVAFRPAMRIGRRIADRLVYGTRATPYEVLTEFSERVGTSYATEDVLPRMAQVLGEGTGADVARIWLRTGATFRAAAVWPTDATSIQAAGSAEGLSVAGEAVILVRDQGEVLGALSVRMPASDPMTPAKERLVRDLAAQAGLVLRNVRLVEDLRSSRQRLVAAQDEERRRLERNIHDGAQQQLVALAVKARLAKQLTERDPTKAAEMLEQIEGETQTALEDLRDLARGIYPPLLADRGLVAAIEAQARKGQLGVQIDADELGRFSADVEATVYFCTLEALQNVAKYAEAAHTVVHLVSTNGDLSFEVVDDGRGFDPGIVGNGSGLQGMADRLAAVGGSLDVRSAPGRGTTVSGRVPVGADRRLEEASR
jgi:signal transduction histidine kinase